jgi:hypothetical protein
MIFGGKGCCQYRVAEDYDRIGYGYIYIHSVRGLRGRLNERTPELPRLPRIFESTRIAPCSLVMLFFRLKICCR